MDELRLLSIKSKDQAAGAIRVAAAGGPLARKMAVTQSKNRDEKKRGHQLPGAAFFEEKCKD